MKLNLGAGEDQRPGFKNIDIRSLPGLDYIQDVVTLNQFENNSVSFIVAQHLLEYLPRKSLLPFLTECRRVLRNKAALEIRVTDYSLLTKQLYLNDISKEMGLYHEMVLALLYGKQEHEYDIRYNGFSSEFLQGVLVGAGFRTINLAKEDFDIILTSIKED